ncbi:MAG: GNAT family N-acetyltransferase [Lachnospiraceae bacterium]|nr:GNAT family N-acetyltransferase [Lachnospiraceae bacterium]
MKIHTPHSSNITALRQLWQEAFGDTDAFLDMFFQTAFCTDRCRCISIDNHIISALYWFDCLYENQKIAYLYAIATAKSYRGQGFCHKLMADTHKQLYALGYSAVILVPGNTKLFRFYEHMHYKTCSYIKKFSCTSDNTNMSNFFIKKIDKCEYANYRRHYLPLNGVIQENENLDFLEQQANFYTGFHDGSAFLLAASNETDNLYGIELLGDNSLAPKIVQALGYKKGTFRTPDGKVPFAMYLSLADNQCPPPAYFGLAFD